jgi:hypothetical protein
MEAAEARPVVLQEAHMQLLFKKPYKLKKWLQSQPIRQFRRVSPPESQSE